MSWISTGILVNPETVASTQRTTNNGHENLIRAQSFLSHFLAKWSCKSVTKVIRSHLGNSPF